MDEHVNKSAVQQMLHEAYADDVLSTKDGCKALYKRLDDIPTADVQPVVETEDLATATEQFICKNCGIRIENFDKIILEEDNDGYINKLFCEYIFKFCPECGAKVESRIKTPKRDKPLYTMDEICKMNGVEFNLRKDDDTNG